MLNQNFCMIQFLVEINEIRNNNLKLNKKTCKPRQHKKWALHRFKLSIIIVRATR